MKTMACTTESAADVRALWSGAGDGGFDVFRRGYRLRWLLTNKRQSCPHLLRQYGTSGILRFIERRIHSLQHRRDESLQRLRSDVFFQETDPRHYRSVESTLVFEMQMSLTCFV